MERKESKGFVELEWVCPNCEGRNKGSKKTCENCGAPQPDNVKFQRAAEEKVVTDEKIVQAAKAGADIHCGFCGTRNSATAVTCSQCGGDLKEGKARQAGQALQAAAPALKAVACSNCGAENLGNARLCKECGAPIRQAAAVAVAASPLAVGQTSVKPTNAPNKKVNVWIFAAIGAFFLICCVAAVMLFAVPSKSVKGTVTDLQWQTSVPVQEIQAVNYSNKSGSAPSDSYNVSCRTEDKEVCEEKTVDQGNGFAEVVKECHTESTQYCDYTLDEWKTIRTYTLDGNDNFPVYENPSLTSNQRIGSSTEVLTVIFSTPDGQESFSPGTVSDFQQYQIGSVWNLKLNALGGVMSVGK
jgi:membrane protease subunit (stomatin/prohibitin family)